MIREPAAAPAPLDAVTAAIGPLDEAAMAGTTRRLDRLTKPPGSLGRLESIAVTLAGIAGRPVTAIAHPAIAVFAADHGVTARGVSPYPAEVTRQMVANFVAGGGAVNVLSRAAGIELVVVDVGVTGPEPTVAGAPEAGVTLIVARNVSPIDTTGPDASTHARSITFCSSRMFPGHA